VYYKCVKFHKNSISSLVGVALARYMPFVSAIPPKRLIGLKLYTVVVHYLQICMKKYGRCPKFGGGDNSTCTFTKRRRACTL
jgi:hypothetical protein